MKLKPESAGEVYFGSDEPEPLTHDDLLERMQGKPFVEQRAIRERYRKSPMTVWRDLEGKEQGRSYGPEILAITITPANPDQQKAEYLRRIREAQQKAQAAEGTLEDVKQAMSVMGEYVEFLTKLQD